MKVYEIKRTVRGVEARVDGETLRNVGHRSKVGFGVGYDSAGAADLALSILADYFGESPERRTLRETKAWRYHQAFKRDYVMTAPVYGFTVTSDEITSWLKFAEVGKWNTWR